MVETAGSWEQPNGPNPNMRASKGDKDRSLVMKAGPTSMTCGSASGPWPNETTELEVWERSGGGSHEEQHDAEHIVLSTIKPGKRPEKACQVAVNSSSWQKQKNLGQLVGSLQRSCERPPAVSALPIQRRTPWRSGLLWRISFWLITAVATVFFARGVRIRGRSFFPDIVERMPVAEVRKLGEKPRPSTRESLGERLLAALAPWAVAALYPEDSREEEDDWEKLEMEDQGEEQPIVEEQEALAAQIRSPDCVSSNSALKAGEEDEGDCYQPCQLTGTVAGKLCGQEEAQMELEIVGHDGETREISSGSLTTAGTSFRWGEDGDIERDSADWENSSNSCLTTYTGMGYEESSECTGASSFSSVEISSNKSTAHGPGTPNKQTARSRSYGRRADRHIEDGKSNFKSQAEGFSVPVEGQKYIQRLLELKAREEEDQYDVRDLDDSVSFRSAPDDDDFFACTSDEMPYPRIASPSGLSDVSSSSGVSSTVQSNGECFNHIGLPDLTETSKGLQRSEAWNLVDVVDKGGHGRSR